MAIRQSAEILDLRLARGVLQHRAGPSPASPPSSGSRSRRPRRTGTSIVVPFKPPLRARDDIALFEIDLRAHRLEALDVQIDRPRADGATAGQRNLRLAVRAPAAAPAPGSSRASCARCRRAPARIRSSAACRRIVSLWPSPAPRRMFMLTPNCISRSAMPPMSARRGMLLQRHRLVGQQRRGHQLQRRILGAADRNFALEAVAAPYPNSVHKPSRGPRRPISLLVAWRPIREQARELAQVNPASWPLSGGLRRRASAGFIPAALVARPAAPLCGVSGWRGGPRPGALRGSAALRHGADLRPFPLAVSLGYSSRPSAHFGPEYHGCRSSVVVAQPLGKG